MQNSSEKKYGTKITALRRCKECGKEFEVELPSKRCFCSDQCRTDFHNRKASVNKRTKYCAICGKPFFDSTHNCNKVYCSEECSKAGRAILDRERLEKRKPKLPLDTFLCGHKDCIYVNQISGQAFCNYIGIKKNKRPCKPTSDCTCYEKRKQGRNKTREKVEN